MHVAFECEVFRGGKRHFGGGYTFYRGVGREVDEHDGPVDRAGLSEVGNKEVGLLEGYAYRGEYHRERAVGVEHLCLARYLRRKVGVRQAAAREYRQLLAADKRIEPVYRRNARLYELAGILARGGVDGGAVDVQRFVRDYARTAVDNVAHAREHAAEYVGADAERDAVAGERNRAVRKVYARAAFKKLKQRLVAVKLKHLAAAAASVLKGYRSELAVFYAAYPVNKHKRAGDLAYRFMLQYHHTSLPSPAAAAVCSSIMAAMAAYSASHFSGGTVFARPISSLTGSAVIFSMSAEA